VTENRVHEKAGKAKVQAKKSRTDIHSSIMERTALHASPLPMNYTSLREN
jgi:hypothetical protein